MPLIRPEPVHIIAAEQIDDMACYNAILHYAVYDIGYISMMLTPSTENPQANNSSKSSQAKGLVLQILGSSLDTQISLSSWPRFPIGPKTSAWSGYLASSFSAMTSQ
jgi:hypothetical protein